MNWKVGVEAIEGKGRGRGGMGEGGCAPYSSGEVMLRSVLAQALFALSTPCPSFAPPHKQALPCFIMKILRLAGQSQ